VDHTARLQSAPSPILNQWRAVVVAAANMLLLFAVPALAHTGSSTGGFIGGFAHPLFGPDHVVAMVAVGLWGAFLGPPAIWLLPIVFPLVLGTMVALAARPPLWVAALIVGVFAIFHGHAHGAELPPGADVVAYSVGFVVATGLLHLTGIAIGLLARWRAGRIAVRTAGGAIALAGVAFLSGFG
jgi:urease accessory protein